VFELSRQTHGTNVMCEILPKVINNEIALLDKRIEKVTPNKIKEVILENIKNLKLS
jgi:hypothetical protein